MKKILVFLPAYNEQENIEALVHAWQDETARLLDEGYELTILPIDDASRDNTKSIMLSLAAESESVQPLLHEKNKGLGGGVNTALRYFNEHASDGDVAVLMDADNSHKPEYVHLMLAAAAERNADCVIASRYRKGSKIMGVPWFRNALSLGARFYYTVVLGVKGVRDYTCGYRLYSHPIVHKAYETYEDRFITQRSFSCMMEALYKLYRVGAKFAEVPFILRYDNKRGESKMNISNTVQSSLKTALQLRHTIH